MSLTQNFESQSSDSLNTKLSVANPAANFRPKLQCGFHYGPDLKFLNICDVSGTLIIFSALSKYFPPSVVNTGE